MCEAWPGAGKSGSQEVRKEGKEASSSARSRTAAFPRLGVRYNTSNTSQHVQHVNATTEVAMMAAALCSPGRRMHHGDEIKAVLPSCFSDANTNTNIAYAVLIRRIAFGSVWQAVGISRWCSCYARMTYHGRAARWVVWTEIRVIRPIRMAREDKMGERLMGNKLRRRFMHRRASL